jgi:putative PIN family toxin of toxin-antitoxin system
MLLRPVSMVERRKAGDALATFMAKVHAQQLPSILSAREQEEEIVQEVKAFGSNHDMPKVVLDSTVLVSVFLASQGISAQLLDHPVRGAFQLYLSDEILHETQRMLIEREHLRTRYAYSDDQARALCVLLRGFALMTAHVHPLTGVSRDPNDDRVIACAVASEASCLVARDKDLLAIKQYQNICLLIPEQFMALLRNQSRRSASTANT